MKKVVPVLFVLFFSVSVYGQNQFRGYAKFVCGKADSKSVTAHAFAPGTYSTTINVGNPNSINVSGSKRISIALLNEVAGKFTNTIPWTLKPFESMQIDCGNIWKHAGIFPGTFIDGFVFIIGAPSRFGVTAVYTVRDTGGTVVSTDVEEITLH